MNFVQNTNPKGFYSYFKAEGGRLVTSLGKLVLNYSFAKLLVEPRFSFPIQSIVLTALLNKRRVGIEPTKSRAATDCSSHCATSAYAPGRI